MAERRPDVLAGLSEAARRRREREDARYLAEHVENYADPAALAKPNNTFGGTDIFRPSAMQGYQPGAAVDCVVCARVDLDHPIYFADNLFAPCADCGCDLQYRPRSPRGAPKLCICCAACRAREAEHG